MSLEETFNNVTKAAQFLYDPATSQEVRRESQDYLMRVQRDPAAWDLGWVCLNQSFMPLQFFGAQTLQIKVSRDFAEIPEDKYEDMREALVQGIIANAKPSVARVVVKRLCLALVVFGLHTTPGFWPSMVTWIIQRFQAQYVALPPDQQVSLLHALVEILRVLPEEFTASNFMGTTRAQILQMLLDSIPEVLNLLCDMLDHQDPEIPIECLKTLGSWVQFGIPISSLVPILNKAVALARRPETFEGALQVLADVVQHSSNARFEETLCSGLVPFIVEMAPAVQAAIEAEEEDRVETVVRFVTALTETFPTWFIKHLDQDAISQAVMPLLLKCIAYPGYPGAEQNISDIPFQTFFLLQEVISDPSQIKDSFPGHGMSTNSSTDSLIDADKLDCGRNDAPQSPQLPHGVRLATQSLYADLLTQLVRKAEWPADEEWQSWTKDHRDRWANFRRDCGDTILETYYVLREVLLEWVLTEMERTSLGDWKRLEAILFCVRSINEAIPPDGRGAALLARVLSPERLTNLGRMHLRVRQTLLYLVGAYGEWFHANPDHVHFGLQVLLLGLQEKSTLTSAAKALREFCDVCRAELGPSLPHMMTVYQEMKGTLPSYERQRVIEAVSMVIQKLPNQDIMEPLSIILHDILSQIQAAFNMAQSTPDARGRLLSQLQLLEACCKGIQSSDWDVSSGNLEANRVAADLPAFKELRNHLVQVLFHVLSSNSNDIDVVTSVCSLVDICIRHQTPPLVFAAQDWLPIFQTLVQSGAIYLSSCVIDAVGALATHAPASSELQTLLHAVIEQIWRYLVAENGVKSQENPDMVDGFLTLLGLCLRYHPSFLYDTNFLQEVVDYSITCLQLKERASLKAAVHFLSDFILHNPPANSAEAFVGFMDSVCGKLIYSLFRGIFGDAPRSMVPNFAEVLYRVITRYPQHAHKWMHSALVGPEAVPISRMTQDERKNALRQLLGTRQMRLFKNVINELQLKARGLEGNRFGDSVTVF